MTAALLTLATAPALAGDDYDALGLGAPPADNLVACRAFVDRMKSLSCMSEAAAALDYNTVCPPEIATVPIDMRAFYGCMAEEVGCDGATPVTGDMARCTDLMQTDAIASPPPEPPTPPPQVDPVPIAANGNAAACRSYVAHVNALACMGGPTLDAMQTCPSTLDETPLDMRSYYACLQAGSHCTDGVPDFEATSRCEIR